VCREKCTDEPTDRGVQRGWTIPEDEIKSEMAKFIPECDNSEEREREAREQKGRNERRTTETEVETAEG
jgi:hypothetical protein